MEILISVSIFWAGLLVGFLLRSVLRYSFMDSSGVMFVTKEEGKTVYSLMLEDYPEKLEFRKHVLFKVIKDSEESLNRE